MTGGGGTDSLFRIEGNYGGGVPIRRTYLRNFQDVRGEYLYYEGKEDNSPKETARHEPITEQPPLWIPHACHSPTPPYVVRLLPMSSLPRGAPNSNVTLEQRPSHTAVHPDVSSTPHWRIYNNLVPWDVRPKLSPYSITEFRSSLGRVT